ncbi:anti-sigma factor family protein [Actinacidiphila yeochonensis]|uniref:anti-sigma factor family protein n=1 Tax=Actinacidiphila yeochonensis TaxID=89050 RepID=UPI00068DA420|nr:zf-HC2 domain-containing protein [Actinacidiphila yeochonensis]
MTPHEHHVDVGAYLLGALDDAEMTRFEEHLAGCEECGRLLDELAGVEPVLAELRDDGIGWVEPPGGDAMLHRLLARVAADRRVRRRRRVVAVAAAALLVVGGPAIAVVATEAGTGGTPAAVTTVGGERQSATNPATGVSAIVGVTDRTWGSTVDLRLTGVRGPLDCHLVAIGPHAVRQTVASWRVPEEGYGTGAHPEPLTVSGTTGLHKDAIKRFEVRTSGGTLLVTVPGPGTPPSDRPRGSTE